MTSQQEFQTPSFFECHYDDSRLDSWDLENLRYIRKKSGSQHLEEYSFPEGELSPGDEEEVSQSSSFSPWHDQYEPVSHHLNLPTTGRHYQYRQQLQFHTRVEQDNEEDAHLLASNYTTKKKKKDEVEIPPEMDQLRSLVDPNRNLDDCYLLDVLTIGNDVRKKQDSGISDREDETDHSISSATKVLPSQHPFSLMRQRQPPPASRRGGTATHFSGRGSLGTLSSSSPSSTSVSGDDEDSQYNDMAAMTTMTTSSCCSRLDQRHDRSDDLRSPESCMVCSESGSTKGSGTFDFHSHSLQKRIDRTLGHPDPLSTRGQDSWRANSPYYMRLRRDICTVTPPPTTPTRFGVDKQGQLVIDYSHNWSGLELYIKQLHLA
ncbi:uncharacterized protein LOC110852600 isoform X1 [Folsomia candida]|uniref:uncharacterized protein LOC110852600 isoform X1 n=1 Tax=Folsomia candida TaxID=158441 RepID=UPI001604D2D9|nr:uncharacterized protein LOC110852600 isoform X1 [Folsomia candida]XP_035710008.1 uncharacterized protein LOC110852600 isoform X1 [Folsomia candida]XP_035710009.1 uncharacterized protein LOC110852600 isoform X1 [Folsomia candida]